MILYSPAKINIGLHILRKRDDAYHDISSVLYPLPFFDMIEIQANLSSKGTLSFTSSGILVPGHSDSNLCVRAVQLFSNATSKTAEVKIHLHKQIPFGAGLGGGSSNASSILLAMNRLTGSPLKTDQLAELAAQLGSDCPVFIYEIPMMASGRGEVLEKTSIDLSSYFLVLLNPGIVVPTAEAYSMIVPNSNRTILSETLLAPIEEWKEKVSNDFENSVFTRHPQIEQLKNKLYKNGAIYASMSGSGSTVYGLYKEHPTLSDEIKKLVIWRGRL